MRKLVAKVAVISTIFGTSLFIPAAWADTKVTWNSSVDASYDLSIPGTILAYKDELNQGGMSLSANTMTQDKTQADIVFDKGGTLGAGSVVDLGQVDYDSVTSVPDSGYTTELTATPGHVYIVFTHDNQYAKIKIKQVLASKVLFTYALQGKSKPDPTPAPSPTPTPNPSPAPTPTPSDDNTIVQSYTFHDGDAVVISWPTTGQDAGYDLFRSDNGGDFVKLSDFKLTQPKFTDNHCLLGHTYLYKYVSYDANGRVIYKSGALKVTIVAKDSTPSPTPSDTPSSGSEKIILQLNNQTATVNGAAKSLDVAPAYVDGRTLVPIRFISEALGAQVNWNGDDQSVTVTLGNDVIQLWLNKSITKVNGATKYLDVPAQTLHDRTMVPVRFVSENLHLQVNFDDSTSTITITGAGSSSTSSTTDTGSTTNTIDTSFYVGKVWNLAMDYVGLNDGQLKLYEDGHYEWVKDSGSQEGKWEKTTDPDYPIIVHNFGFDGKTDMKMGKYKDGMYIRSVRPDSTGSDYYVGTLAQ